MSSQGEIQAALAWADRIEAGEGGSYDPYIVALAHLVREQGARLAVFETAISTDPSRPPDWEELLAELHRTRDQRDAIAAAASRLDAKALAGAGTLMLDGTRYRVIEESEVRFIEAALRRAVAVIAEREEPS